VAKVRLEANLLEWSQKVVVRSESNKHCVVSSLLSTVDSSVRCEAVAGVIASLGQGNIGEVQLADECNVLSES